MAQSIFEIAVDKTKFAQRNVGTLRPRIHLFEKVSQKLNQLWKDSMNSQRDLTNFKISCYIQFGIPFKWIN